MTKEINVRGITYQRSLLLKIKNKKIHSVDSVSIKCSKIPGTSMFTTAGKRKSISISNEGILNAWPLYGSDLTLTKPLYPHLPQHISSSYKYQLRHL